MDNLSNQYVTGYFNSDSIEVGGQTIYSIGTNTLNDYDAFVAKFDSSGSLKWIKQIGQVGGSYAELLAL
ncbi:MAG: hypothetical protein IPL74_08375 [Bacteroidetes bacterium]|nr:hypothetical protein [Bacteroidota bacterium]